MSDEVDRKALSCEDHRCIGHFKENDSDCTQCWIAEECDYRTKTEDR